MQSVRTGLWIVVTILVTSFAYANFVEVEVSIFPGYRVETYISIVALVSFLLGFLPTSLSSLTNRWRLQRKIKQQDDTIAMLRPTPAPTPPAPVIEPSPTPLSATDSAL